MSVQDVSSTAAPDLSVEVSPDRERVIVVLAGELDLATAGRVEQTARELYDRGFGSVVLDLRALTFMDSSGLKLLLRLHDHAGARRCQFAIIDDEGPARRLLQLTRLTGHFTHVPPAAAAIRLPSPV